MSELTSPIMIDIPGVGSIESADLYLKSEADNVIAEKDSKIIQLEAFIENYNRISREIIDIANHQKHKRCLANAEACKHKRWRNDDEGFDFARSNRQMLKWLELAEKFKSNSTAQ